MKLPCVLVVAWKVLIMSSTSARIVKFITIGMLVLVIVEVVKLNVMVNVTASIPAGIYGRKDVQPTRGAFVVVCLPARVAALGRERGYVQAGQCPGRAEPVGKRLVALGGDRVGSGSGGITIEGCHLPDSEPLERDSSGRLMAWVERDELPLQPAEVWLMGDDRRSWDSRYYGPVPVESVVAVVEPLWTWE